MANGKGAPKLGDGQYRIVGTSKGTVNARIVEGQIVYTDPSGRALEDQMGVFGPEQTDVLNLEAIAQIVKEIQEDVEPTVHDGGPNVEAPTVHEILLVPHIGAVHACLYEGSMCYWNVNKGEWINMLIDSPEKRALMVFLNDREARRRQAPASSYNPYSPENIQGLRDTVRNFDPMVTNNFGAKRIEEQITGAFPAARPGEKWVDPVGSQTHLRPKRIDACAAAYGLDFPEPPTHVDRSVEVKHRDVAADTMVINEQRLASLEKRIGRELALEAVERVGVSGARAERVLIEAITSVEGLDGPKIDELIEKLEDLKEERTGKKSWTRAVRKFFEKLF